MNTATPKEKSPEIIATDDADREERAHARRSSSSLGSVALCEGYESRKSGKTHWVTSQGLRGHDALETGNFDELESGFEERMVLLCQAYVDRLPAGEDFDEIRIETIEGRWGFSDKFRVHSDLITRTGFADLVDYKFVKAKEAPDAEINVQGKDYVAGLFRDPRFVDIHTINVHFLMPRFGTVTKATFTRDQLPQLEIELYALLRKAKRSDHKNYRGKTLTPHYDACRFCKHSGTCRALRKIAAEVATSYDPEGKGFLDTIPLHTHASDEKLTPAERGRLQLLAGVMSEWASAVKHHNSQAALMGEGAVEGFAIHHQKGKRIVKDAHSVIAVAEEFGLTPDDLVECSQLGFGKLENKVKEKSAPRQKGADVTKLDERLREMEAIDDLPPVPKLVRTVITD